ncbi:MAG: protein-L-isoaspartate O-methyltransferase family protein, partial [Allosphingosinicella sp.]
EHAPFDRMLITAAAKEVPSALIDQLAPGGLMVIPLGDEDVQQLSLIEKNAGGSLRRQAVLAVRFTRLETD